MGEVISIDKFYLCLSNREGMIIEAIVLTFQDTEQQHLASDDLCKESWNLCHSYVYLSLKDLVMVKMTQLIWLIGITHLFVCFCIV